MTMMVGIERECRREVCRDSLVPAFVLLGTWPRVQFLCNEQKSHPTSSCLLQQKSCYAIMKEAMQIYARHERKWQSDLDS